MNTGNFYDVENKGRQEAAEQRQRKPNFLWSDHHRSSELVVPMCKNKAMPATDFIASSTQEVKYDECLGSVISMAKNTLKKYCLWYSVVVQEAVDALGKDVASLEPQAVLA